MTERLNRTELNAFKGFPGGSVVKESLCRYRRCEFDPWVRKIPWRRKWQPTPVFLSGKFRGQKNLGRYNLWDPKEWDMTELLSIYAHRS